MRALRVAGVAAAGLALILLLAAALGPGLMDWDRYRGAVAAAAAAALGRPVQIAGPIRLTMLPHPVLVAGGVTLPDPGDGIGAEIAELHVQAALGPLLAGRLEPEDFTLYGAEIRLPWPLRPGFLQHGAPAGLHGRLEASTIQVGNLALSEAAGTLAADPLTGTLSVTGVASALGWRWQATARLGRAGGDGSAPLDVALAGEGAAAGTEGTLSGQLAADGELTGHVTAHGPDLSQLLAAPAAAWRAAGRFRGGDGLALADDLDAEIGGQPLRAAVALRLLPALRLDAALAAGRLDLDAWLPRLMEGSPAPWPTSVDLSAEAATLAGGTLRHLRAALDLSPGGARVREGTAVLPGDAALTLSGTVTAGRFTGAGQVDAPALQETLRWLAPLAPALASALPPGTLQSARLDAQVSLADGLLALDGLSGRIDGAAVRGALAIRSGTRPGLGGTLTVTGADLDPWLPALPTGLPDAGALLAAWPGRWGGLDLALALSATGGRWHGAPVPLLDIDAAVQAGTLTLRRGVFTGPEGQVEARFSLAPGGQLGDAHASVRLGQASLLLPWLPADMPTALLQGPAALEIAAAGNPAALALTVRAKLAGLTLAASGPIDLRRPAWAGTLNLQHPSAPGLLEGLGAGKLAPWLGEGALSLTAAATVGSGALTLDEFTLAAGLLHATGNAALVGGATPAITGTVDAQTLPLPWPAARSPDPLPVAWLRGWRLQAGLRAGQVLFARTPAIDHAAAAVSLADGVLTLAGLRGTAAGGALAGEVRLDAGALPRLNLDLRLDGAGVTGPLLGGTLDVTAGRLDAAAQLAGSGYSPAALLATLEGTVRLAIADGILTGLDLAAADAALDGADAAAAQSGVAQALQGGRTAFGQLTAEATVRAGTLALGQVALAGPPGAAMATGTLDLPADAADLQLAFTPAHPGAPPIGLRLLGHPARPRRTPELAKLSLWLAER